MMKQEFEQLIGKEVSYETFRIYEEMYHATPESVTKQKFVEMLNIAAIPESEEAIARKEKAAAVRKEISERIAELKRWLEITKDELERYIAWSKEPDGDCWKVDVKIKKGQIKRYRAEIASLKMIAA